MIPLEGIKQSPRALGRDSRLFASQVPANRDEGCSIALTVLCRLPESHGVSYLTRGSLVQKHPVYSIYRSDTEMTSKLPTSPPTSGQEEERGHHKSVYRNLSHESKAPTKGICQTSR